LIPQVQDPIIKFTDWWKKAKTESPLAYKSAVCVSTIDVDGYPTGRFVDLKSISKDGFIFCTSYGSKKGLDIERNPKISLTFWWEHVGYQVRVNGSAEKITDSEAIQYWESRSHQAHITTLCSEQSKPLDDEASLEEKFNEKIKTNGQKGVPRPETWGGYLTRPNSIEFLTFRENRLHLRELYKLNRDGWELSLLQP
jgi:pyridoxamine 5'-phosphate oxidase